MKQIKMHIIVPMVLGVLGTLALMLYPAGHKAFCAGVTGLGL